MNTDTIAKLQQMNNEMEALIEDDLARFSDLELSELVDEHIEHPMAVTAAALMKQSPQISILAGCMVRRVLLRRLEAKAMQLEGV